MLGRMLTAVRRVLGKVTDKVLIIVPEDDLDDDPEETESLEPETAADTAAPDRPAALHNPSVEDTQSLGAPNDGISVIRHGPLVVCVARPRTINEAAIVGERLRDHMVVLLNLEIEDKAMGQRIFDYGPDGEAVDEDGRLSVLRLRELVLRALPAQLGEPDAQRLVGTIENGARHRERLSQLGSHADVLTALPGK